MQTTDVELSNGLRVSVAEAGAGGRPFLLIHGFTGAKEDFTDWLEPLADLGWHAVAIDNRGHGASGKPADKSDYSFEILAADALALADDRWGAGSRFVLLGHSMGGMVAQVIAMQNPERIDGLILMDTGHGALSFIDRDQAEKVVAIVEDRGIDGLADLMADREQPLSTPADARLLAEREGYAAFGDRKLRATATAAYAGMLLTMVNATDRLDALRDVAVPTLVLVGEQDAPLLRQSRNMAEAIPGAELAVLPDAGHSPQFENTEAWWKALTDFLSTLPR